MSSMGSVTCSPSTSSSSVSASASAEDPAHRARVLISAPSPYSAAPVRASETPSVNTQSASPGPRRICASVMSTVSNSPIAEPGTPTVSTPPWARTASGWGWPPSASPTVAPSGVTRSLPCATVR